ncbi:MAG: bifunctional phosphoribosylaminoimidazolecarboxamide formyltransferase/IMP cyclohydrolase, partial [Patescibacteria group bacterium]
MDATPTAYFPKNALISVYNKEGIVEFAQALIAMGWKIWASGGTARTLDKAGLEVHDVADMVGEAILDHRVVTLSREVHAGLLAFRVDTELAVLEAMGVPFFDLMCGDFYPLAEAIAKAGATRESVIAATDIGGPTMVRSAAKGGRIVIADPVDRQWVLQLLAHGSGVSATNRQQLAAKAEMIVSRYVHASANYLSEGLYHAVFGTQVAVCKYGENPWQTPATHYRTDTDDPLALQHFQQLAGAATSFNNLGDVDRALQVLTHIAAGWLRNFGFLPAIAVGVKHGNAC